MSRISRRELLRVAGLLGTALAGGRVLAACGGGSGGAPGPDAGPGADAGEDVSLPSLGGAPDDHEGRTIAAFCDVVVPGRHRDPTGAPGAIDVGAPALFFDPELPAAPYVGILVAALDAFARQEAGSGFASISVAARENALERAIESLDVLDFAVQLAKLATFASPEMGAHLGYPGPNSGYLSSPDFSFGVAMSRELTQDGNLD